MLNIMGSKYSQKQCSLGTLNFITIKKILSQWSHPKHLTSELEIQNTDDI
jgi:hypothetical protein